jgi:hypothetical protein
MHRIGEELISELSRLIEAIKEMNICGTRLSVTSHSGAMEQCFWLSGARETGML